MSLATLKRKSNTTYKNLSGKSSGDRFVINKQSPGNPRFKVTENPPCINKMFQPKSTTSNGPNYNTITGTGGGFSINGKRRNIGRVGQHMRMSKGLSRMKSISSTGCAMKTYTLPDLNNPNNPPLFSTTVCVPTKSKNFPVWKGAGGKIGNYGRGEQPSTAPTPNQAGGAGASGKYGVACCVDNTKLVKPSVLSFKGMINARNRWVSLNIPDKIWNEAVTDVNLQPYDKSTTKVTYNNWVQLLGGNSNVQTKTQGQYIIDKIKPSNQVCVLPARSDIPSEGQPLINKYQCKSCNKQVGDENNLQTIKQRGQCIKCYSRIGGKYYPPTPFSKQVSLIPSSSNYISVSKRKNSNSATQGWSAKWPPATTLGACLNPYSNIIASEGNTKYTILKRKAKEQENVIKNINQTNNCNKGSDNRSAFIQFLKSCKSDKSPEGIKNFMVKYKIPVTDL
tara:strand:+ start:30 stop:1379 length:1350 start_codon:yes stop_codon:yes gene_type:complete